MKKQSTNQLDLPDKTMPIQDEATLLISQAIDKNVDVTTMEKLMEMRGKIRAEKAKEAFNAAMAAFQRDCPTIKKKVQGYNYKYADLTTIVEQIKHLLSANGFSYTFDTDEVENKITVYCRVKHIAGHEETSKAVITRETTTKMNASQQSGAAMTYGKRYAFINALGVLTGDEDTDAASQDEGQRPHAAAGSTDYTKKDSQPVKPNNFAYSISYPQQRKIFALLTEKNRTKASLDEYIKNRYNQDSIRKLSAGQANELITKIEGLEKLEPEQTSETQAETDMIEGFASQEENK